jgi:hypothetical protein
MDAFQLLEEAGNVPPAQNATIDAAVDLVLTVASREGNRSDSAPSPVGRRSRRHRRIAFAAVASAVAGLAVAFLAVAFLAVSALTPASHKPGGRLAASHPANSHPASGPGAQLAAWTVTRQADGNIQVTFREATDPTGLQRTLRADGVPASVTFTGQQNPACQPYTSGGGPAFWPFGPSTGPLDGYSFIHHPQDAYNTQYALVIDPSTLPSGAGLQIWTSGTSGAADNFQLNVSLVKASPQCTGS